MNGYQVLTLLVAIVAVIIAAVSFIKAGKIQKQQLRLNILTEELSKKQLNMISKDEILSNKARVEVDFQPHRSHYHFTLTNASRVVARDVSYIFVDCPDNPIVGNPNLPLSILQPGQTIRLLAARDFQSPPKYKVEVFWVDPDGSEQKKINILTV